MKRSIIALCICAAALSSCVLKNGGSSPHSSKNMESYTKSLFTYDVYLPAAYINTLVMLDEYIVASDEEKQSDAFEWHRKNIFHEDDRTFYINDFGTVKTHGQRLRDADPCWETGIMRYEQVAQDSWKVMTVMYDNTPVSTTVTYAGKDSEGRNRFGVDVYRTDSDPVSSFSEKTVNATIFTDEDMTIINPLPQTDRYNYDQSEGSGVFRIETDVDGSQLDWMELRYSENGKSLVFDCSLISSN